MVVRHYRSPKRPDRADGGWLGQSRHSGGNITPNTSGSVSVSQNNAGGGLAGNRQHLPPGHPSIFTSSQQVMGPTQPGPLELSNFWNVLQALGGQGEIERLTGSRP